MYTKVYRIDNVGICNLSNMKISVKINNIGKPERNKQHRYLYRKKLVYNNNSHITIYVNSTVKIFGDLTIT